MSHEDLMMRNNGNAKWIIVMILPSGNRMVATSYDGCFAMVPIDQITGVAKGVFYFDTYREAEDYIADLSKNPMGEKLFKYLAHEIIQAMVAT